MEQLHVATASDTRVHHVKRGQVEPQRSRNVAFARRDACIQTEPAAEASVPSSQPSFTGYPSVTVGHHYGKEYLNPSPILPHIISPDALEGAIHTHVHLTRSTIMYNLNYAIPSIPNSWRRIIPMHAMHLYDRLIIIYMYMYVTVLVIRVSLY